MGKVIHLQSKRLRWNAALSAAEGIKPGGWFLILAADTSIVKLATLMGRFKCSAQLMKDGRVRLYPRNSDMRPPPVESISQTLAQLELARQGITEFNKGANNHADSDQKAH